MRLMEVGTKQQSLNNTEEANKLFDKSYELYCLFWGLNMNMLNIKDVKWIEDTKKDIEAISDKVSESMNEDKIEEKQEKNENKSEGVMDKMKNFVKKAVNCCIE